MHTLRTRTAELYFFRDSGQTDKVKLNLKGIRAATAPDTRPNLATCNGSIDAHSARCLFSVSAGWVMAVVHVLVIPLDRQ